MEQLTALHCACSSLDITLLLCNSVAPKSMQRELQDDTVRALQAAIEKAIAVRDACIRAIQVISTRTQPAEATPTPAPNCHGEGANTLRLEPLQFSTNVAAIHSSQLETMDYSDAISGAQQLRTSTGTEQRRTSTPTLSKQYRRASGNGLKEASFTTKLLTKPRSAARVSPNVEGDLSCDTAHSSEVCSSTRSTGEQCALRNDEDHASPHIVTFCAGDSCDVQRRSAGDNGPSHMSRWRLMHSSTKRLSFLDQNNRLQRSSSKSGGTHIGRSSTETCLNGVSTDDLKSITKADMTSAYAIPGRHFAAIRGPLLFIVGHLYVIFMAPIFASFDCLPLHPAMHAANVLSEVASVLLYAQRRKRMLQGLTGANEAPAKMAMDMILLLPGWTTQAILVSHSTRPGHRRTGREVVAVMKLALSLRLLVFHATEGESSVKHLTRAQVPGGIDPILLFRIAKLSIVFLAVIHYCSCAYHALGRVASSEDDRDIGRFGYYAFNTNRRLSVFAQWTRAYFWAVSVILGSSTLPRSSIQTSFHTFVFLLGIVMTTTMTGCITSLVANSDVATTQRHQKMASIRKYFRVFQVPSELAETIESYYRYLWDAHYHDDHLFDDLSDSLRLKLNIVTKPDPESAAPIFRQPEFFCFCGPQATLYCDVSCCKFLCYSSFAMHTKIDVFVAV